MQRTAGASIDTLESDWATVANSPHAKASILLASLPSSLDNVVDTLTTKTGLTYEDITNRLTDHVSVNKSRKNKDEDNYLFIYSRLTSVSHNGYVDKIKTKNITEM
jgi:hypothetical protein